MGLGLAPAALVITIGEIALEPDTPGQERALTVTNTGQTSIPTSAVILNLQIAGGWAEAEAPKITAVDILASTIFEEDNFGETGGLVNERRVEIFTLDNGAEPTPSLPVGLSTLATVTFDTTGFFEGSWNLSLTTPAGPTTHIDPYTINPIETALSDGTVSIREEPGFESPLPDPTPRLMKAEDAHFLELTVSEAFEIETSVSLRPDSWTPLRSEQFTRINTGKVRVRLTEHQQFFRITQRQPIPNAQDLQ